MEDYWRTAFEERGPWKNSELCVEINAHGVVTMAIEEQCDYADDPLTLFDFVDDAQVERLIYALQHRHDASLNSKLAKG